MIESGKDRQVESLAAFATRRLGREAYQWLAQPLAAGIYGGDPRRLSMQAAFPQFIDWEQRHGSLTAAMQARAADSGAKQAPGARYDKLVTLQGGVEQLTETLVRQLPNAWLRAGTAVRGIERIRRCDRGLPGLALAGSGYEGVGIPQCIASGRAAAKRVRGAGF